MASNSCINSFLDRLKGLFSAKKEDAVRPEPANRTDAVRPSTENSQTSSQSRMEAIQRQGGDVTSSSNLPAFKQGQDLGYQASRSGAAATRRPQKQSSTYHKLQALSASGTGAAAPDLAGQTGEQALNSILERLDKGKKN